MASGHDPGLERGAGRVGGNDDERVVLEHDAGTGAPLVLERVAEDALGALVMKATCPRQLVEEAGRNQRDRIELRVRVLERGTGRPAVVIEDQYVLKRRVLRVMPISVDVGLHDLLHLAPRQQWSRGAVIGAADQHLAGADRIPLPETAIMLLLAIRLEAECRIQVWDHTDPPALRIGSRAGGAIREDLRRRHGLMSWAEGADVAGSDELFSRLGEGIGPARALRRHRHPPPGNQVLS